ncbi:MAG: hypothetical protein ABH869_06875 [Candidatus Omnitrophota bacterium]
MKKHRKILHPSNKSNKVISKKLSKNVSPEIKKIYELLEAYFGDLGWWPAESPFEVIVGAILTQNTAWSNVAKAIESLRKNDLLEPEKILAEKQKSLSCIIRSAGYYRIKAGRLKNVCGFLMKECDGAPEKLRCQDTEVLRKKLLNVKGIGPETADSILLYALDKPAFVVDAYTKRIFFRHGLIPENASYDEVRRMVQSSFPLKIKMLNQYHAVIVETGKRFCRKKSGLCEKCPLKNMLKKI